MGEVARSRGEAWDRGSYLGKSIVLANSVERTMEELEISEEQAQVYVDACLDGVVDAILVVQDRQARDRAREGLVSSG